MAYIWFLFVDLPLSLLRVLIILMGPMVVTIALPFARDNHLPSWAAWWDNPDYGIKGNKSYLNHKAYNPLVRWAGKWPSNWYWLVARNPANGLTRSPLFSVVQKDMEWIKYKGNLKVDNGIPGWHFVYGKKGARFYTGFYYYVGQGEYRLGFKLLPDEKHRARPVGMTFILNPFKRA